MAKSRIKDYWGITMKTIKLKGYNNFELIGYAWDNVEKPIGVVQIIHGMQEHAKRYNEFAKYLNSLGLIVFASDLRGHGQTAIHNNLPFGYSDGDIFMEIVHDHIITDYLLEKYKLPVSIFGHSFGSFITQRYIIENGFKIKNVILCGSTYTNSAIYKLGFQVARLCKLFKGKKAPAKLIENMSIKGYCKHFPYGNWLTRDNKIWEKYREDEMCGKTFPVNFYYSFFKNARKNYKNLKNIPYFLPILIISGTDDPVAGKHGIVDLFFTYGKAKKKVFFKSYLDDRHELLNELDKDIIYNDVKEFIINNQINHVLIRTAL